MIVPMKKVALIIKGDKKTETLKELRKLGILPSEIRRSRDSFAISLRTGSKQEITTASGVSSIMMSTPVNVSNVLMLRPSRPIIRPFISSLGSETVVTVISLVVSGAMR